MDLVLQMSRFPSSTKRPPLRRQPKEDAIIPAEVNELRIRSTPEWNTSLNTVERVLQTF